MALPVRFTLTPQGAHKGIALQFHGAPDSWIPSLQNQGDEWQRTGQAGAGAQIVGTRGRKKDIKAWRGESTQAAVNTFVANFEAIEEEICSVLDGWGRTLSRVRITNCKATPVPTRGPLISAGVQVLIRIECEFTAERLPDG